MRHMKCLFGQLIFTENDIDTTIAMGTQEEVVHSILSFDLCLIFK